MNGKVNKQAHVAPGIRRADGVAQRHRHHGVEPRRVADRGADPGTSRIELLPANAVERSVLVPDLGVIEERIGLERDPPAVRGSSEPTRTSLRTPMPLSPMIAPGS